MKYITVLLIMLSMAGHAQKFKGLAITPPMGWNSWNCFQCDKINEDVIKEIADAMIESGMKDVGYEYVIIDDCWQIGRDQDGVIIVDSIKFPNGIKILADYVHSKGLRFGIYSDAGTHTCGGRPGSKGYEQIDAETYAEWGVDYLKYDWCNTQGQDPLESYTLMRDALFAAGRPVVFSICDWGISETWKWAGEVGHLWRTTYDIADRWDGNIWGNQLGWTEILEKQNGLEKYAGPGRWNDPDMLEVGNDGLTVNESRTHFIMWCMLAAPLITGNDLRSMSSEIIDILTHPGLISINQDTLGKQGYKIYDEGNFEIWEKPLSDGNFAICLLNLDIRPKSYKLDWDHSMFKNLPAAYGIINLWTGDSMGKTDHKMDIQVRARDAVILRLSKSK